MCRWICTRCRQLEFSLLSEDIERKWAREEKELSTERSSVTQLLLIRLLPQCSVARASSNAGLVRLKPATCVCATRSNSNSVPRLGVIICKLDGSVLGAFRLSCMSSSLSRLELIYSVGFSRRSALSTLFTELIINLLRNREEEHTFVGSKTRTAMIVHLQVGVHSTPLAASGGQQWGQTRGVTTSDERGGA